MGTNLGTNRTGLSTPMRPTAPAHTVAVAVNPLRIDVVDADGRRLLTVYDTDTERLGRAVATLTETMDALLSDQQERRIEAVRIAS